MSEKPFISIIIPTRHRETILWQTVEKGLRAIEGKNAEMIVVNDGDTELNAREIAEGSIRFYNNPLKGVTSARNLGASVAKGDTLLFIDDDMWINTQGVDWIIEFMGSESNRKSVYNLNWQYPDSLNTELAKTKIGKFLINANYHQMWGRMKEKGVQPSAGLYKCNSIASCSLLLDKDLFERIGKYKEELVFQGEDIELSDRLNSLHIPIYAVFDVMFFHNHQDRMEINGFLKRVSNGYQSEFEAMAKGHLPKKEAQYSGSKKVIYEVLRATEFFWMLLYKALPNIAIFDKLNIRLVGMLTGLQKFKQWKYNRL
jgi:glycosyltransferase involved in cell wall biosynthesis